MLKTIREKVIGKAMIRLLTDGKRYKGAVIRDGQRPVQVEGVSEDEVWHQLHAAAARANPDYFGFEGARNRFLRFFPNGFHSAGFAADEREYKLTAKAKLETTAPLDEALTSNDLGEAVLRVFQSTNLLSPYEKPRVRDVLLGPSGDAFIQAAARLALGETISALSDMDRILAPHASAKWTVATYLPFLWKPEEHMFLKPEVTKDFAARVGHRFAVDYQARLGADVYASLLDLVATTSREIRDLRPRDGIDLQSFIWVVGGYPDNAEPKP